MNQTWKVEVFLDKGMIEEQEKFQTESENITTDSDF